MWKMSVVVDCFVRDRHVYPPRSTKKLTRAQTRVMMLEQVYALASAYLVTDMEIGAFLITHSINALVLQSNCTPG